MNKKSISIDSIVTPLSPLTKQEPIVLESAQGITLKCGETTLRLLPNGDIQLNGQRLRLEADQTMTLEATQIRVNCEDSQSPPAYEN